MPRVLWPVGLIGVGLMLPLNGGAADSSVTSNGMHCGVDWPQWGGGPDRNMASSQQGLPDSFAPSHRLNGGATTDVTVARNVRWAVRLGTRTFGSPTVAGGRVLVGSNGFAGRTKYDGDRGALICLDEATGKLLWELNCPRRRSPADPSCAPRLGLCSSAAIDGDRAYVLGYGGDVLCVDLHGMANGNQGPFLDEAAFFAGDGNAPVDVDALDGDILWRVDLHDLGCPPIVAAPSILVHGGLLYVGTGAGGASRPTPDGGPAPASVVILNKRTGALLARDAEFAALRSPRGQWSSPALLTDSSRPLLLHGGGDGVCYAFEATFVTRSDGGPAVLRKRWWADLNALAPTSTPRLAASEGSIVGTPVVWSNAVYISLGHDWTRGHGPGRVACIEAEGAGEVTRGAVRWCCETPDRNVSTPAIADGLLYYADLGGRLRCLDAATGAPQWTFDLGAPAWQSALVADGKVYAGHSRGTLFVLAAGRTCRLLGTIHLGRPMAGAPVAANGSLYVATYDTLYAFEDLPSSVRHPADAVEFNGHWYHVFEEAGTWHDAERRCRAMGGYLACIETREEQQFLACLAKGLYLWLGGTDERKEGEWHWVNGSPFSYTAWMDGQPNNWGGDENYLATYDCGEWQDAADEGKGAWMPTGFICEWER